MNNINTDSILPVPREKCVYLLITLLTFFFAWKTVVAEEKSSSPLSGDIELGINARDTDFDRDLELEQVLRLRYDPAERENIRFRTTLWAIEDLDGHEDPSSPLAGLNDSEDSAVDGRILSLYLEIDGERDDHRFRLGRQRISKSVAYNRIDGGYFEFSRKHWSFYSFLGVRASVYESRNNDLSSGGGVTWTPIQSTRVSVDLFHGDDERRRFGGGDIESTLTSVSMRHAFNARHSFFARGTWLESHLD